MDSRNNSPRNQKQQELINRLEEIRRQRTNANSEEEPRKRNESSRQSIPERASQPRRNRQTEQTRRPTSQRTDQFSQPSYRSASSTDDTIENKSIYQDEIEDKIRSDELTKGFKKTHNNYSKPLLNQLSSSKHLVQAVILNEVLSKPIAMRYKNR